MTRFQQLSNNTAYLSNCPNDNSFYNELNSNCQYPPQIINSASTNALNEYVHQALEAGDVIQLRSLDSSLTDHESAYMLCWKKYFRLTVKKIWSKTLKNAKYVNMKNTHKRQNWIESGTWGIK